MLYKLHHSAIHSQYALIASPLHHMHMRHTLGYVPLLLLPIVFYPQQMCDVVSLHSVSIPDAVLAADVEPIADFDYETGLLGALDALWAGRCGLVTGAGVDGLGFYTFGGLGLHGGRFKYMDNCHYNTSVQDIKYIG